MCPCRLNLGETYPWLPNVIITYSITWYDIYPIWSTKGKIFKYRTFLQRKSNGKQSRKIWTNESNQSRNKQQKSRLKQLYKKNRPLMYEWHGKKYWGAADGLAGIMHVLMEMEVKPDEADNVKGTLRTLHDKKPFSQWELSLKSRKWIKPSCAFGAMVLQGWPLLLSKQLR